jgi:DNA-binding NtrC family response regulator
MNARVIAATHHSLKELVAAKVFREDLYYRINVIRLSLPNLAERKEDIPILVDHFVEQFNSLTGKQVVGVSDAVLAAFALHDWPGNIRELENAIEHAFILCNENLIDLNHLPETIAPRPTQLIGGGSATLKEIEKRAIAEALIRNGGRRMATARELGIHKNTLRRKIQAYDIDAGTHLEERPEA